MSENFTYEKIECYLLQQMTASEQSAFENEIEQDPQLAQQVEQQKLEHKMMESLIEKDLLKDLNKWKEEEDEHINPVKPIAKEISIFRNRYALAIAATLALLIAAFLWMNRTEAPEIPIVDNKEKPENTEVKTPDPIKEIIEEAPKDKEIANQEIPVKTPPKDVTPPKVIETPPSNNYMALADTYYESTDFGNINVRGEESDLSKAIQSIKDKDINSGISGLSAIVAKDNSNLSAYYYLALAYNNQKKFKQAIPHFEKVSNNGSNFLYIDDVQWLLALAYLQTTKNEKAKVLLKAITSDTDHPHYAKAIKLLEEIK